MEWNANNDLIVNCFSIKKGTKSNDIYSIMINTLHMWCHVRVQIVHCHCVMLLDKILIPVYWKNITSSFWNTYVKKLHSLPVFQLAFHTYSLVTSWIHGGQLVRCHHCSEKFLWGHFLLQDVRTNLAWLHSADLKLGAHLEAKVLQYAGTENGINHFMISKYKQMHINPSGAKNGIFRDRDDNGNNMAANVLAPFVTRSSST